VRIGRAILFWIGVVIALFVVELAELTHLFTLPVQSALGNLLSFVFALVFTTILALVGAIFVGIYISQRLQGPPSFTPFEVEMLKMRAEVRELREELARQRLGTSGTPEGTFPPREAPKP
jgi:hypothetical protein